MMILNCLYFGEFKPHPLEVNVEESVIFFGCLLSWLPQTFMWFIHQKPRPICDDHIYNILGDRIKNSSLQVFPSYAFPRLTPYQVQHEVAALHQWVIFNWLCTHSIQVGILDPSFVWSLSGLCHWHKESKLLYGLLTSAHLTFNSNI